MPPRVHSEVSFGGWAIIQQSVVLKCCKIENNIAMMMMMMMIFSRDGPFTWPRLTLKYIFSIVVIWTKLFTIEDFRVYVGVLVLMERTNDDGVVLYIQQHLNKTFMAM